MTAISTIKEPVFNIMQRAKQCGVTFKRSELLNMDLDNCDSQTYWIITGNRRTETQQDIVLELRQIFKEIKNRLEYYGITVNKKAERLDLITESFRNN